MRGLLPARGLKKAVSVTSSGRSRFRREAPADAGRKQISRPWREGKIDLVATLYHAWKYRRRRPGKEDLRAPEFQIPQNCLQVFLLDVSDSMAATLELMRTWVTKVLSETYLRRDPVTLLIVQGTEARVLAPPTTSLRFLLHHLSAVTEGGATPLRRGLCLAERVVRQWRDRYPAIDLTVVTDGRSTEPLEGPEFEKSLLLIRKFVRETTVVNPVAKAAPFARAFATLLGARYLDPKGFL